jgi:hypothetical protein
VLAVNRCRQPLKMLICGRSSSSHFVFLPFEDTVCACSGLERDDRTGIACCTLYSFRLGPITKSCLPQGAPGGVALSMGRAARAA